MTLGSAFGASGGGFLPAALNSPWIPVALLGVNRVSVGGESVAHVGGASVLPHDRGAVGLARRAVPGHDGLALVRDTDGRDAVTADLLDDLGEGGLHRPPDLGGVVLDPSRLRVVLRELAVRRDDGGVVGEHRTAPDTGGPGVDGDHDLSCAHGRRA